MNSKDQRQGPPKANVGIDIEKCDDVCCKSCKGLLFVEKIRVKKLSSLLSPTGREERIEIRGKFCLGCNAQLLPER